MVGRPTAFYCSWQISFLYFLIIKPTKETHSRKRIERQAKHGWQTRKCQHKRERGQCGQPVKWKCVGNTCSGEGRESEPKGERGGWGWRVEALVDMVTRLEWEEGGEKKKKLYTKQWHLADTWPACKHCLGSGCGRATLSSSLLSLSQSLSMRTGCTRNCFQQP